MPLRISPKLSIPDEEISETFVRASGAGGQHVQKASTAVQLRFDAFASPVLSDRIKMRLRAIAGQRMTDSGEIVIFAQQHRSQLRNREDALERLAELLREAAAPPPPVRRKTRPTKGSQTRRMDSKTKHGATKKLRSGPISD
ncbi:aminoacyl-tRNA hydrolase [Roseococcus sp. SYP-B2431]|uniref:alternative ribosome rescue aminoacyl-tRNA hydrolase ArfB n=1 Tax=Roseococcus sp. SYP-B2431 TaxID=2496640 RepID=UPI0010408EEC|nr:alternative ribosome rescue aminoacyl-tRNA hydrolase ArfB [Roseococcus sp. SYP-B2431]TCH98973.1 aminoacyl-tRNA hydrolase [Roseococcus sp. SYP-B2431]